MTKGEAKDLPESEILESTTIERASFVDGDFWADTVFSRQRDVFEQQMVDQDRCFNSQAVFRMRPVNVFLSSFATDSRNIVARF